MLDKPVVLVIGETNPEAELYQALQQPMELIFADNADQVIDLTSDNETIDVILVRADRLDDRTIDTCQWIKTDGELKQLPFAVVDNMPSRASQWLSVGAIDVITADLATELFLARLKLYIELKHKNDLLSDLASLDRLTSLPDHGRMDEYLDIEWRRSLREFYPLSIIVLDLDGFQVYRERYGIGGAEDTLRRVARLLESMVNRAADMLSHYGDNEFVVMLPSTELDSALVLAERMVEAVADMAITHEVGSSGVLTASAGVATIEPSRDKRYRDLQDEAYEMLARARQMGGNQAQGIAI